MRSGFRLDPYNIIIVALIPFVVIAAWGLVAWHDYSERRATCDNSLRYLDAAAALYPLYVDASTVEDASPWLDQLRALQAPGPVLAIHQAADRTISWAMEITPSLPTTDTPGELYDQFPALHDQQALARDGYLTACPDNEQALIDAFPMIYTPDNMTDPAPEPRVP